MTAIPRHYARLAQDFTAAVAAVPDDRWADASPCPGWTARDVVRHVVETQAMFLGFIGGGTGDGPSVDDDPLTAWKTASAAVQAELDDPDRAGTTFEGLGGTTRFDTSVDRFLGVDLIVHRWDLARATGQDERITAEDVRWAAEVTEGLGDAMRGKGAFGPALTPPSDADEQTRLLAFLGRRAW